MDPFRKAAHTLLRNQNIKECITDHQPAYFIEILKKIESRGEQSLTDTELQIFLNRMASIGEAVDDELERRSHLK